MALTLKKGIHYILSKHKLDIQNIQRHGYDGASNMRGGWNGLQTLVSTDYPYPYYVHCFAHLLQLDLVATSKEVIYVDQFCLCLMQLVSRIAGCPSY